VPFGGSEWWMRAMACQEIHGRGAFG
jgi:hypothetical protein